MEFPIALVLGVYYIFYVQCFQSTPVCPVLSWWRVAGLISYNSSTISSFQCPIHFFCSVPCVDPVAGVLFFSWSSLKIRPRFSKLSGAIRFLCRERIGQQISFKMDMVPQSYPSHKKATCFRPMRSFQRTCPSGRRGNPWRVCGTPRRWCPYWT